MSQRKKKAPQAAAEHPQGLPRAEEDWRSLKGGSTDERRKRTKAKKEESEKEQQ